VSITVQNIFPSCRSEFAPLLVLSVFYFFLPFLYTLSPYVSLWMLGRHHARQILQAVEDNCDLILGPCTIGNSLVNIIVLLG